MVDKRYLNWKNKVGYGTGDIAGNVIYAFLSTFLMFYLTDTVGMNMGIAGVLIALSNLLDGLSDLFFGILLDRTKSPMGRARPWMLFGYIGCAVMLAAVFMIPTSWGKAAQYAYFFITYTLLNGVFYTANNISYATLTALVTKNTSERVQLGSIRFIFAFATTMILQAVTIDVVTYFGGDAAAWKSVALIYAVIGLVTNTVSALSVRELPPEELYKTDLKVIQMQEKPYTVPEGAGLLFSNRYYMMVCGILFLTQLCQSSLNMGVYFMKYVLGGEGMLRTFTLCANIPLILGLIIIPWLVKKLRGMYKLHIAGYFLAVLGRLGVLIGAYLGSIPAMLVFTGIASIGTCPLQGGLNALIASCSEHTFLTRKRRIDGTMYSCSSFGIKVGAGFGSAICGWMMEAAGYVENAAAQSASTVNMLHILYLWVPVIANLAITLLLTRLNVEKANEKALASGI